MPDCIRGQYSSLSIGSRLLVPVTVNVS